MQIHSFLLLKYGFNQYKSSTALHEMNNRDCPNLVCWADSLAVQCEVFLKEGKGSKAYPICSYLPCSRGSLLQGFLPVTLQSCQATPKEKATLCLLQTPSFQCFHSQTDSLQSSLQSKMQFTGGDSLFIIGMRHIFCRNQRRSMLGHLHKVFFGQNLLTLKSPSVRSEGPSMLGRVRVSRKCS